tara:strand:- start:391 stop:633 length:243 start_codon:yes stop_codon:yes gene_type:complete
MMEVGDLVKWPLFFGEGWDYGIITDIIHEKMPDGEAVYVHWVKFPQNNSYISPHWLLDAAGKDMDLENFNKLLDIKKDLN